MSSSKIIKGAYDAFAKGDVPAVLGTFDSEILWKEAEGSPYADGNPYIGPHSVAQKVFQRYITDVDNFTLTPENIVDAGNTVLVEGRYTGTWKSTGTPLDVQFAHVWELKNGKVVRFQQYTDTKQWAEAAEL